LFGTAQVAGAFGSVGAGATAGLIGSAGSFSLATGTLTSGLYSAVSNIGFGTIANLAGAGMSAYGAAYQGAVQSANYEYQAGMMAYNKKISENNALMARRASEFDADTSDFYRNKMVSAGQMGFVKGGVVINQGTPDAVSLETETQGSLERLAILYKGETQAEAYLQQAVGQEAAAARYRLNAQMAGTSAAIGATKELAKGAYTQYRYGAGTSLLG
tara:strand:+ start:111 stop:758 length:648 start_codon:yes stop_codon:yes gene_type:complete